MLGEEPGSAMLAPIRLLSAWPRPSPVPSGLGLLTCEWKLQVLWSLGALLVSVMTLAGGGDQKPTLLCWARAWLGS